MQPSRRCTVDATERPGVVRDVGVDRVEEPDHRVRHRARARLVQPAGVVVGVVAQVELDASGLAVDLHVDAERDAVGEARVRVVRRAAVERAAGELLDRLLHTPLAVVEPLADHVADHVHAVVRAQLLEPPLRDAGRAQAGEEVAVPLLGHADAAPAHADDVVDVLEVALHAHAGERQRTLVIDVFRARHVRRRQPVATVGLVGLRDRGEEVLAADDDGDEDRVVGRVRVAEVGVVVEEGIAAREVVVQLRHRLGEVLRAHDVHRQALGGSEQFVVGRHQRAGEVARLVDDRRARGAQERVGHLTADAVEAVGHDGQQDRVERLLRPGAHAASPRLALTAELSRSSR